MRRLLLSLIILLCLTAGVDARGKLQGWAAKGGTITTAGTVSTTKAAVVYPLATITFYQFGTTTLVVRYDSSGNVVANPTSSDSTGYWSGYFDNGRIDVRIAPSGGSPSPFTISDLTIADSSAPFNVADFGITGVAHGGTPSDESTAYLALLTTVYNAGGGVIQFNNRAYRFDSSWLIPNNGAGTPSQPSLRITGMGASDNGQGGAPSGGTIIDLRYNSTLSKIDTRGLGHLEIDHIHFKDGGSASSVPFIHVTNTSVSIHDNGFLGNTANTPTQDAIIFGGTATGAATGNYNSPFQGYKSHVTFNYFNRIQRAVLIQTYGNAVDVSHNNIWSQCGGTTALEIVGDVTNTSNGNLLFDNLIEVGNYTYGIRLSAYANDNHLILNNFYDETGTTVAMIRIESNANYNYILAGRRAGAQPHVQDANAIPAYTFDSSIQSEASIRTQPITFRNSQTKIVGDNSGLITEDAAGNHWIQSISPSAFGHPFGITYTPSGGSLEAVAQFYRASATDKQFILNGSALSTVSSSASDLRVQAATGQTLCLGTTAIPCVFSLVAAGTSTALPITSTLATSTAPFTIASTTKVTNLNVDQLDGQDWTSPTFTTSAISPLWRSTVAKVLLQGTGTGATQISSTQTTPPTCSSNCGTSPSVAGSDSDMRVTMGAAGSPASGFVITFNGTWATAPVCSATMATTGMVVGKLPLTVVTTTTTVTIVTNGTAPGNSDTYAVMCRGLQ